MTVVPLWAEVRVTLCLASTPLTNLALVTGEPDSVALDVIFTVPVNPVTVLPLASSAVMVTVKGVPAVCGEVVVEKMNLLKAPGLTVKALLVPVWPLPSLTVSVVPLWAEVMVRLWLLSTPLVNEAPPASLTAWRWR